MTFNKVFWTIVYIFMAILLIRLLILAFAFLIGGAAVGLSSLVNKLSRKKTRDFEVIPPRFVQDKRDGSKNPFYRPRTIDGNLKWREQQ